jgi:phytoene dehydrogenase-like protein
MARSSVIIIGGGIGGLSAGCYLRMNGYDTHILEMANQCGGVCVPWKRGDYLFDGSTNWLPGSSKSIAMHGALAELFDFSTMTLDDFSEFASVDRDGETLHVYTDMNRLRFEMLRLAPEDKRHINRFINAIIKMSKLYIPYKKPVALMNVFEKIVFGLTGLPLVFSYLAWNGITIQQFADGFKNRRLGEMVVRIFMHHNFFSVMSIMMSLSWMHAKSAGYPKGGSANFIGMLQNRYSKLGGKVTVGAPVKEILVENDCAVGVRLLDGSILKADIIVSAADLKSTLDTMLNGRITDPKILKPFSDYRVFPALLQVSLGVARTFNDAGHKMLLPMSIPFPMGNDTAADVMVRICNFDDCYAPEGKTALIAHLRTSDWKYWADLRNNDKNAYRAQKEKLCAAVIETLDKKFPGLKNQVETSDVATPATWIRYNNVWQGSYQAWAPTPGVIGKSLPFSVKGLKNFYLAGQWLATPGGLPRVVILGRQLAQTICKDDRKSFTIKIPGTRNG